MFHKFIIIGVMALVVGHGEACNFCRPKFALPPIPVPSIAFPLTLGLPCAEPVSDCGPQPAPLPIIQAPPVTVPTIEGPIIPLPSPPIPCPRTIGHKCVCTKTVVKPQLIQRCITIPAVQRYLKRTYTPVIENIAYKAKPKCPPGCSAACACQCAPRPPAPACAPPPPMPLALPFSRIC